MGVSWTEAHPGNAVAVAAAAHRRASFPSRLVVFRRQDRDRPLRPPRTPRGPGLMEGKSRDRWAAPAADREILPAIPAVLHRAEHRAKQDTDPIHAESSCRSPTTHSAGAVPPARRQRSRTNRTGTGSCATWSGCCGRILAWHARQNVFAGSTSATMGCASRGARRARPNPRSRAPPAPPGARSSGRCPARPDRPPPSGPPGPSRDTRARSTSRKCVSPHARRRRDRHRLPVQFSTTFAAATPCHQPSPHIRR